MRAAGKHHRGSILMVDDTPANLQLLIEALGEQAYEVRPAINGKLALESARSLCPDLVLLDINMPGMDGYEVCRRLKADPTTKDVPVIFISSMDESLDKVKAFSAGGVDYISKPFQTAEVLARIKSHLELRRTQLELAKHKASLEQLVAERTLELKRKNQALEEEIETRKRVEEELRISEQSFASLYHQFDTLLDAISDPLVLLSSEMRPVWTNAAYDQVCEQLGCGPASGQTLFHLGKSGGKSPVKRCFEERQVVEDLMTTPDQRTWGVKTFPMPSREAQVGQVIAIAVDVTEKVRLREEANRASRLASLGELAAGIAHEINNPNAVILMNMPILKDVFADAESILHNLFLEQGELTLGGLDYEELQVELPSLIDRVQESAERIKRIVDDLKNFVRDEGPKELAEVDVNLVVQASVRLLENSIKKATSNFHLDLSAELPPVRGDFQKLEQVAVNLIQNACQALTSREQEVRVTTAYLPEDEYVLLKVSDHGGGIEPAHLERIRDPFFTTKRKAGGTGLGLSVSERILQENQGLLQVESIVGEGSEFSVLLPVWEKEG